MTADSGQGRLFIVGAMKAGTTSLFADLASHPSIGACSPKEPSYFTQDGDAASLAHYHGLFPQGTHDWLLDGSTNYAKHPMFIGAPRRIAEYAPDARIIFMVRDPIARITSHHRHNVIAGRDRAGLAVGSEQASLYISISNYELQMQMFDACFRPEQILIIPFEGFVLDRAGWVARIHEWLGIEAVEPPTLGDVLNQTVDRGRLRPLGRALGPRKVDTILARPFGRVVKPFLRDPPPAVDLTPELVAQIRRELAEPMREFAARVGPDFTPWLDGWLDGGPPPKSQTTLQA